MSAGRFFAASSKSSNTLIPGNTEFSSVKLANIQWDADPSLFYTFVIDSISPDDAPGEMKICEIQPALTSVLPEDVIQAMVATLDERRHGDKKIGYLNYQGIMRQSIDINSDRVETITANYLDDSEQFRDSILLFAGDIPQHSYAVSARYKEISSLKSNPASIIFYDKIIQRILLSIIAPHLNPDNWFAFEKNHPPTIAEIKAAFPDGYIIKGHSGTRGNQVTTVKFKTDSELKAFLDSAETNFFVVESFVKGTKKHLGKTHTAARRWCCTHIDNDTIIHGAVDQLAPIALDIISEGEKIDRDLVRVSHSKGEHTIIKVRPDIDIKSESVESTRLAITNLMREIEKIVIPELLDVLLKHHNTVYQKLAIQLILNAKKIFFCREYFYSDDYGVLIEGNADKFNALLDRETFTALIATLERHHSVLEDPDWAGLLYGKNASYNFNVIRATTRMALEALRPFQSAPMDNMNMKPGCSV